MKFDPNIPIHRYRSQSRLGWLKLVWVSSLFAGISFSSPAVASDKARLLANRTIERLVYGDAFDAKLRQRVWVAGREIIGVGQYEQAGNGTGRYLMELTMHDGDTKQSLRQVSDGRLTWTRTQISSEIAVGRVDLGRIDEYERERRQQAPYQQRLTSTASPSAALPGNADRGSSLTANATSNQGPIPARYKVGGLAELLDRIANDYDLVLKRGTVERQPCWILHGRLSEKVKQQLMKDSGRKKWAPLCPVEVRVAVAATGDATGFGTGLPLRIEFWSEPEATPNAVASKTAEATAQQSPAETPQGQHASAEPRHENDAPQAETDGARSEIETPRGRLISILEIYDTRRIKAQPEEHFRFQSDDVQVTFVNETKTYLDRL